jgi:protein TonB
MPVAILIHFVVLGSVAFANYWSVSEVAEPDFNVVFLATAPPPPPPPPPPAGGGNRPIPTRPEPVPEPETPQVETIQPDLDKIPEAVTAPLSDLTPADPSSTGGEPGGVPGGVPNGVPGGVVGSTGVTGGVPGSLGTGNTGGGGGGEDDQPIRFRAEMTRPVTIHQVAPRYTAIAIKASVQGVVTVDAVIDEQGNVTNVRVLRGLPMGLDRSAVEAVRQWRFTPAKLDGKPVKVIFTLTVNFTIQR